MKTRRRAAKRFGILLLALGLAFGTLETGLRLLGRGVLAEQEEGNQIRPEDAGAIRIVAIGDSTTADVFPAGPILAWPRKLERRLRAAGFAARVYNLGRSATNSSMTLAKLPEQLDRFRPQIAISMMGFNDTEADLIPERPGWFGRLKTARLFHFLALKLAEKSTDDEADALAPRDFGEPAATREILRRLGSDRPATALGPVPRQLAKLDASDRARYLLYLAETIDALGPPTPRLWIKAELLRRSLAAKFQVEAASQLARLLPITQEEDECLALAREIVEQGRVVPEPVVFSFQSCASQSWNAGSLRKGEWPELLRKMSGGGAAAGFLDRRKTRERNYRELHRLLAARGITHIAMQYPTLDLEDLKDLFRTPETRRKPGEVEPEFRDILFVGNQENFEAELARRPYSELFIDRFATRFGHTTDLGHSLIEAAAEPAVREAIRALSRP